MPHGDTFFFAQSDGIPARYQCADGQIITAEAGLHGGFTVGSSRIVTLTWDQAMYLRRLDGEICVGQQCNLYLLDGSLHACEGGSFSYCRWTGDSFLHEHVNVPFHQATLITEPVAEPFTPPYEKELHQAGPGRRWWQKLTVTTPDGFVSIDGEYDTAQLYVDGELLADNFFSGESWQIPARLLYGRTCYLVMSELKEGSCYLEYRQPLLKSAR